MRIRVSATVFGLLAAMLGSQARRQNAAAQAPTSTSQASPESTAPRTVLRTTVRRVVLDVVVTDAKGVAVPGLTKDDFHVTEDGQPQRILSFDANGFSPEMDYVPPSLPAQAPNTFINLPATPEKGPLYVLLYDMTNMDNPDQMDTPEDHGTQLIARQQMMKFIREAPEGARFAIFVRSDGLHLVQGFTSDKETLYRVLDPHHPRPHFPAVFLMGESYGRGDRLSSLYTLHNIAQYLDGLPGRKNLIWFSASFPLSLFASDSDGRSFREETKATLDMLAHDQIAVYPVDARGVPAEDSHNQLATSVHSDTTTSSIDTAGAAAGPGIIGVGNAPSTTSSFVQGSSSVVSSYQVMDSVARQTGGRAFYGNNDVAHELVTATEDGGTYYTLTYAPTNTDFNGGVRNINVQLAKTGYQLSYRRAYYGLPAPDINVATTEKPLTPAPSSKGMEVLPPVVDRLSANMQHGAPTAHQLVFIVQAKVVGAPEPGTPQQMADLATEPAYFTTRHRSAAPKPLAPIPLQKDLFTFEIPTRQFHGEPSLDLELAAAAYDADGLMMNAVVRVAKKEVGPTTAAGEEPRFFRVEQELEVPLAAATVRFAVRDTANDRTGAVEVTLPLAAESEPTAAARR